MIQPTRIKPLNDLPVRGGASYVLYWMGLSQRARFNPALEYAVEEANRLGLPVLVLDTTEASRAVPAGAGWVSNDPAELRRGAEVLLADLDEARARGEIARAAALERYPLERFLAGWDAAYARAQELVAVRV